jgi:Ca-activated chloride channel family protein
VTGGHVSPGAREPVDPLGESISYHEDLWPRCIALSIGVFLLDLLVRRVRIFDRKLIARPAAPSRPS